MTKTILFAIAAALPMMAQETAPAPAPVAPQGEQAQRPEGKRGMRQRPQMTEEQKAEFKAKMEERKAEFEAKMKEKKAEFEAKMLEKYDTNKDGQLDDQEKEAAKAEFQKNFQGRPGMKGPRPEGAEGAEGRPGMKGPRHEGKPGMRRHRGMGKPEGKPEGQPAPAPEA